MNDRKIGTEFKKYQCSDCGSTSVATERPVCATCTTARILVNEDGVEIPRIDYQRMELQTQSPDYVLKDDVKTVLRYLEKRRSNIKKKDASPVYSSMQFAETQLNRITKQQEPK